MWVVRPVVGGFEDCTECTKTYRSNRERLLAHLSG